VYMICEATVTHAAKHMGIQCHRSSIHNLLVAFQALPGETKTIDTVKHKTSIRSAPYAPHITADKNKAIKEHEENCDEIKIYSDRSAHSRGVGAVAILIRPGREPRSLAFHLGSDKHHTVYKAEIVSLMLAAKLLLTEEQPVSLASIFIDNKAAIQSGASPSTTAGSYLIDKFARSTRAVAKKFQDQDSELQLTVRWIPGHKGVLGNELADAEAKRAAESPDNSSARRTLPKYLQANPLPHSTSAIKQWHQKALMERWKKEWSTSPR
jgi:ribonuclease HI